MSKSNLRMQCGNEDDCYMSVFGSEVELEKHFVVE
jgi:hypothetical protein